MYLTSKHGINLSPRQHAWLEKLRVEMWDEYNFWVDRFRAEEKVDFYALGREATQLYKTRPMGKYHCILRRAPFFAVEAGWKSFFALSKKKKAGQLPDDMFPLPPDNVYLDDFTTISMTATRSIHKGKNPVYYVKFNSGKLVLGTPRTVSLGPVKFTNPERLPDQMKVRKLVFIKEGQRWCVAITVEEPTVEVRAPNHIDEVVGVDFGLRALAYTSKDQKFYSNFSDKDAAFWKKRKRLARVVSRRAPSPGKPGSKRYRKAKAALKTLLRKEARKRDYIIQDTSSKIVRHAKGVAIEDTNVKDLSQGGSRKNRRRFYEAGIGKLKTTIEMKAKRDGKPFTKVPAPYTSQDCHVCGTRNPQTKSGVEVFTCNGCGSVLHRDHNASLNIRNRGFPELAVPLDRGARDTVKKGPPKCPQDTKDGKPA